MSGDLYVILPVSAIALVILVFWLWHLGRRVSRLEASVRSVETDLKHLPTKDDIHAVSIAIAEMRAEAVVGREGVRALRASVDRVEGFLFGRDQRSET